MPFVFSHVEYYDMHFVYGFCDGNARAAVEEYMWKICILTTIKEYNIWNQATMPNVWICATG